MTNKSPAVRVFHEVNKIRRGEGLEPISMLHFAHKVSRFHEDRNPRVAQALRNLGMEGPSKPSRGPSSNP